MLVLAAVLTPPSPASATLAWPHFLEIRVENRRADTRVVIESAYAGLRWTSQPGVAADSYLVRVDRTGYVRSLDGKLTFWRSSVGNANVLRVHIVNPGVNGSDIFPFTPGNTLGPQAPNFAAGAGNRVRDTDPNTDPDVWPGAVVPVVRAPMDFEVVIAKQCRGNQFIQVTPAWTNTTWVTPPGPNAPPFGNTPLPGSTPIGAYRIRLNPDYSVTSLDGKLRFTPLPAAPQDRGQQDLGVIIVHSCDPAGDGGDIVGWDYIASANALRKQTSFAEAPPFEAGYGWQPYNGVASLPRESFAACNYTVLTRNNPSQPFVSNTAVCDPGPTGPPPTPPPPGRTVPPVVGTTAPPTVTPTTAPPPPPTGPGPELQLLDTVGPDGFVARAVGRNFPPNADIQVAWDRGIGFVTVRGDGAGSFQVGMLVLPRDVMGPRKLLAGMNFQPMASDDFLVVPSPFQPASAGLDAEFFRR